MILDQHKTNLHLREIFFDMAHSPCAILNENLEFIDVNQATLSTLDIDDKEIIGKTITQLFPHLEGDSQYNQIKNVLITGIPVRFEEFVFPTDQGTYTFIIKAFKVGRGLGLSSLNVTNLTNTIKKYKVSQHNIELVNKRLKEKNEELEEFSFIAAHDLKAPLSNLQSLVEMIENENFLTETGKFTFSKLRQVTDSMCSKIDALNKVIAMKSYVVNDKEKMCFSKTMESIKLNHSEEIVKTRTVIKEDFSRSSHINYDPVQFDSILNNLISNSLKFRQPNYRLVIRVSTKKIGEHTELTIKDNGLGFNEKLGKSKIFGLFKRMHTHVEGSGIGLYIVNSIVTSNGGYIKVSSEVNKGTIFKLYLK